jgi:hypothetical protein
MEVSFLTVDTRKERPISDASIKPFRKAMAKKFPYQRLLFASWHRPRDIRFLSEILVRKLMIPLLLED